MTNEAGAATFYTTGMEHSPTSATGTGWERTPWHATQRAAWEALLQEGQRVMPKALLTVMLLLVLPLASVSANQAHDILAKMSAGDRNKSLTRFMQQSGEACAVTNSFFQGFSSQQNAHWNVRCSNGRAFAIMIYNDAKGSTKIIDCASLKMVAGVECFKEFPPASK